MEHELYQIPMEDSFPSLGEIPDPPSRLYARGILPPPHHALLTVVGSRALSSYGREACTTLIKGLAGYPVSIISGLALGTDALAHTIALQAGLHCIAVPGSSITDSELAPRTNVPLAQDILKQGGCLVSEFAPGYTVSRSSFPRRNRIMAGMSHAVLMVEAAEKSGTLITARLTSEYNRELLAVPHPIFSPHGYGANLFIRLGATLVSEPAHILEALGIDSDTPPHEPPTDLSDTEQKLYELLDKARTREELTKRISIPSEDMRIALATLELKGHIKEEAGKIFRVQ